MGHGYIPAHGGECVRASIPPPQSSMDPGTTIVCVISLADAAGIEWDRLPWDVSGLPCVPRLLWAWLNNLDDPFSTLQRFGRGPLYTNSPK